MPRNGESGRCSVVGGAPAGAVEGLAVLLMSSVGLFEVVAGAELATTLVAGSLASCLLFGVEFCAARCLRCWMDARVLNLQLN